MTLDEMAAELKNIEDASVKVLVEVGQNNAQRHADLAKRATEDQLSVLELLQRRSWQRVENRVAQELRKFECD